MKRLVVLAAMLALVGAPAALVSAQDVDFSGTWNLDRDNSVIPQGRGGGRGGGGGLRTAETLVISQTASSITFEQQGAGGQSRTLVYALDGSETTIDQARGTLTATSRWDGATLVTSGNQEIETQRGNFSLELTERRTLSTDGQTLTAEITRTTPAGDRTSTLVYKKAM
jgi:hypothetical protein